MIAVRHGNEIHIGSFSDAAVGLQRGYRVQLHDLPKFSFIVDAPTGEDAVRIAFRCAQQEGRAKSDAATFQRMS